MSRGMPIAALLLAAAATAVCAMAATAQSPAAPRTECARSVAALVQTVRRATNRYRDVADAMADGYRRTGQDLPGMGEHWISLHQALSDEFDPARPAVLLYLNRGGKREIVGAAFTSLQDPGEALPGPAFLRSLWHAHGGALDQELLAASHITHGSTDPFKVLVVHVWTIPVSAGSEFDVENWRLPFLRSRITPPANPDIAVARAVSLAASADYYNSVLVTLGVPRDAAAQTKLRSITTAHAQTVQRILQKGPSKSMTAADESALRREWAAFKAEIGSTWPQTRKQVNVLDQTPHRAPACD